jgi:hypothetical protein
MALLLKPFLGLRHTISWYPNCPYISMLYEMVNLKCIFFKDLLLFANTPTNDALPLGCYKLTG